MLQSLLSNIAPIPGEWTAIDPKKRVPEEISRNEPSGSTSGRRSTVALPRGKGKTTFTHRPEQLGGLSVVSNAENLTRPVPAIVP